MRCPQCKNKLVRKVGDDTEVRPGGKMRFTKDGLCKTRCHFCKTDVVLPLQIVEGTEIPTERYVVRNKG